MKTLQELEQQLAELQQQIEALKAKPLSLDDLKIKECDRWYINFDNAICYRFSDTNSSYSFDTAFFTQQEAYAFQQWNKVRRAWLQADGACSVKEGEFYVLYEDNKVEIYSAIVVDIYIGDLSFLWFKTKEQAQDFIDFMRPYGAWNKETYELK